MKEQQIAVLLKNVSKTYMLFKSEKQRIATLLLGREPKFTKKVADDISLTIYQGESVALFGQNGAGKSSLLKMITGVSYPSEGFIRVNGRVSALLELTAGFDLQLTGRENIYLRGEILGLSRAEIRAIEDPIVRFADLGRYIDQPVRSYSSGMRARLGFAINANIRPEILIVDEALSVGDSRFRAKCKDKINEILQGGATFLFVTHSLTEAKSLCKRGIVLEQGRLLYDGPVAEAAAFYERVIGRK